MSNNSSNWCPDIYRNLFVDRFNQDAIRIAPCCQAKNVIEPIDTFNFETNTYLTRLRQQNANNERPTECQACWRAEDIGQISRRNWAVKRFDQPSYDVVLEGLDHSATWACNLACVMCGPINSSTWAKELNFTKDQLTNLGRQYQRLNNFTDRLDLSAIVKVYFNGGEPLLTNEHSTLLEYFDKQSLLDRIYVSYTTNGTIMPSPAVMALWDRAKAVSLIFSIDGTDQSFNYIRWPGDWHQVSSNIEKIKLACPKIKIGFNVTVGTYNILEVDKIWHWFLDNVDSNGIDFNLQLANQDHFNLKNLTKNVKQTAIKKLQTVTPATGIADYISTVIDAEPDNYWITMLDQIDARRGTTWRNSLAVGKYY